MKMDVNIHLDRWEPDTPRSGKLRARVLGGWKEDPDGITGVKVPIYGCDLLADSAIQNPGTAVAHLKRMFSGPKFGSVDVVVDAVVEAQKKTLNDQPISTSRSQYGWRSSGRR